MYSFLERLDEQIKKNFNEDVELSTISSVSSKWLELDEVMKIATRHNWESYDD